MLIKGFIAMGRGPYCSQETTLTRRCEAAIFFLSFFFFFLTTFTTSLVCFNSLRDYPL